MRSLLLPWAILVATLALLSSGSQPLTVLDGCADGLVPAVAGTIHGHRIWFDLDTGALQTYLDASTARELALPSVGSTTVSGAGKGAVNATRLQTVAVRLGDVIFQARDPIAIDLGHVGSSLQLGGILGFDFFRQHVVAIDFHSYRVALYDPVAYRYAGKGVAIPLVIRPPRAYVNVIVAAEGVPPERHSLRLDLGSNDAVDDDIVLRSSAPKQPISGGVGVGQRFPSYLGRVSELQLGPFKLYDLPAATGGVQLIGDAVWHRFNVVFDFSRSVMYLEPIGYSSLK
ncbi:MAG: retropepsin-like aspartic protease [Candidatus Cybelea sp.]|jgi:Aspartyl protease